jgi:hypothetical protein
MRWERVRAEFEETKPTPIFDLRRLSPYLGESTQSLYICPRGDSLSFLCCLCLLALAAFAFLSHGK